MKTQGALIYEQILNFLDGAPDVEQSIVRNVASPQFEINLSNGATIRFFSTGMKSGGKCLTPDHDVLVRDGWKPIADVLPGEEIASYDKGQMIWSKVSHAWAYDHDDDIVTHQGKQLSFSVTPNHKFLAKTRYPDSEYRFVEAENLKDYAIPTTGVPFERQGEWFSGDELELWGWWLSEGSGYIGKMARFSQVKEYGRARMVELAQKLGLHYTTPAREVRIEWRPPIECGMTAYNKFIPRLLMEEKEAPRLLEGLLGGDGYIRRKGWEYSSSSYALANDVQELAVRLGFRANIREKKLAYVPVGGGVNNPHWAVSAYPREEAFISKSLLKREKYNGKVHCVTVEETGVFLTRHNGLVHITGNSDVTRGQEAHVIILDELDYMGDDDLEAVLAMMTKTAKNQKPKQMIGASTPTGRHSTFWRWCTDSKSPFREFWFPSYCNPEWDEETEEFFRAEYTEMGYRHEIEADWGEDVDGVFPRKYVDIAFSGNDWDYELNRVNQDTFYVMGVDWDKYGAGTNIVCLEVFPKDHANAAMRGKYRICYREETKKDEYLLMKAMDRIIKLHERFHFRHIYVDRGYGEVQVEYLHKYGQEHPETGLYDIIKGVSFAESIEVRDPYHLQKIKKEVKPYMVDNLRQFFEKQLIMMPEHDEEMYKQIISYVVARQTQLGRPVFESKDRAGDHALDALMLACLAITQNYGELLRMNVATDAFPVSNRKFLPVVDLSGDPAEQKRQEEKLLETYGSMTSAPVRIKRSMTGASSRSGGIKRGMF
jgi:hypothetical protein